MPYRGNNQFPVGWRQPVTPFKVLQCNTACELPCHRRAAADGRIFALFGRTGIVFRSAYIVTITRRHHQEVES